MAKGKATATVAVGGSNEENTETNEQQGATASATTGANNIPKGEIIIHDKYVTVGGPRNLILGKATIELLGIKPWDKKLPHGKLRLDNSIPKTWAKKLAEYDKFPFLKTL